MLRIDVIMGVQALGDGSLVLVSSTLPEDCFSVKEDVRTIQRLIIEGLQR